MDAHIAPQARLLALLRLLLLAIALGTVTLFGASAGQSMLGALQRAHGIILAVGVLAALLAATVPWVRARWQLGLHLACDLLWICLLLYWTGGLLSPGVVLLYALVVIGNVVLPGYRPFLLPALAGTGLGIIAALHLAGWAPAPPAALAETAAPSRILAHLVLQTAGLFIVDALAAHLVRRASEQRIVADSMLEQLGEGVLAVDAQGRVMYANAEALRMLGLAVPPPPGAPLPANILPVARALLVGERLPDLARHRTDDGRELVLRVGMLRGRRGRPAGRILVVADETRLRLLEDTAKRSEALAALGEMAAGIAHEVRNPLTSLRGCAQELLEAARREGREGDAELARLIVAEADRLDRIVGDVLALSRQRPPLRRPCPLPPLLAAVAELLRHRPDLPPDTAIVVDCAPDLPTIDADADHLRQALVNLGLNALEALRAAPRRELRLAAALADGEQPLDGPAVRLSVADTGCGIPPEHLAKVATPFWSTKPQGTGLGLSVVSRIVRDHEGAMRIASRPGEGTTVDIFLPAPSLTRRFRQAMGGR